VNTIIEKIKWRYSRKLQPLFLNIFRSFRKRQEGINLIGFFSNIFGIAEVARFFAMKVEESNTPFCLYDVQPSFENKIADEALVTYARHFTTQTKFHKNIFFINADGIDVYRQNIPALFVGRYNAAVFFWEFDDYFHFPKAFEIVDEVIAFTDFITTAVKKAAPEDFKVTKMLFPFTKNWTITDSIETVRKRLQIPADCFVFIFNFDFQSVYDRKNPEAILRAMELAFTKEDNVRIVFKVLNADKHAQNFYKFNSVIESMQLKAKLILIDEKLDKDAFMSIINASDCYISLHRSEGLGLGLMEAMSMGVPAIATNYGGNLDFMNGDNALMVDYTLVPVAEGCAPYQAGWLWADAEVKQAASYMRRLYDDRLFAKELGRIGKESIEQRYHSDLFQKELTKWMAE
jgi:glycosyltransferase involved in cell wall biosynthesis